MRKRKTTKKKIEWNKKLCRSQRRREEALRERKSALLSGKYKNDNRKIPTCQWRVNIEWFHKLEHAAKNENLIRFGNHNNNNDNVAKTTAIGWLALFARDLPSNIEFVLMTTCNGQAMDMVHKWIQATIENNKTNFKKNLGRGR